jgi:hypothetical protein
MIRAPESRSAQPTREEMLFDQKQRVIVYGMSFLTARNVTARRPCIVR